MMEFAQPHLLQVEAALPSREFHPMLGLVVS
jgi:hypothetical protein